jgi:hypothetical protein
MSQKAWSGPRLRHRSGILVSKPASKKAVWSVGEAIDFACFFEFLAIELSPPDR